MGANPVVLVFVHGGVHTGACWDDTIAAIGRAAPDVFCFAVDLPGRRGVPGDLASLTTDRPDRCRGRHAGRPRRPLAGRCRPAGVVARLAGRVDHVVFVACCVPPQGKCVVDTLRFPLNAITRWVIRRAPVISRPPPGLVRFFFANGATRSQRDAIRAGLCPESSAMLTDVQAASLPSMVQTSWVLPTRDRALRPATQRGFIQSLGGVDHLVTIDAGHEVMLTHPEKLATAIIGLMLGRVV